MNAYPKLTFKQQRFVEEYQVDSNGSRAVLRAGYQTKHPAEMAYELLRNTTVKHTLQDAQNDRSERLQMQVVRSSSTLNSRTRLWKLVNTRNHSGHCLS